MRIRPITSADDVFSAWFETYRLGHVAEFPAGPRYRELEMRVLQEPSENRDVKLWLAEDDGRTVGAAALSLPLRDNTTLGEPEIWVRPDAWRRGVGRALLETVERTAREYQRTSLLIYLEGPTSAVQTSGTRFLEKHGFTRRITEIARVQRPPFDLDAIAKAEDEARPYADGYQILAWRDRVPDDLVDEYARLEGRLSTDAPLGELDYQPEVWDEARIRQSEERQQRMGRSAWSAVAVAADETMAGLTRVTVHQDSDEVGFQDTTLVDPAHRGHRLGLLLKAANFRQVLRDRPGVQAIWTWNADSNQQMIGINETLGYRVEGWAAGYQRDL
jgi:GNAT superfamily N-acetyltransferase